MWSSILFRRVLIAFTTLILISAILFALLVSRGQEGELRAQLLEQLRVASVLLGELSAEEYARTKPSDEGAWEEHLQAQVRSLAQRRKLA